MHPSHNARFTENPVRNLVLFAYETFLDIGGLFTGHSWQRLNRRLKSPPKSQFRSPIENICCSSLFVRFFVLCSRCRLLPGWTRETKRWQRYVSERPGQWTSVTTRQRGTHFKRFRSRTEPNCESKATVRFHTIVTYLRQSYSCTASVPYPAESKQRNGREDSSHTWWMACCWTRQWHALL